MDNGSQFSFAHRGKYEIFWITNRVRIAADLNFLKSCLQIFFILTDLTSGLISPAVWAFSPIKITVTNKVLAAE